MEATPENHDPLQQLLEDGKRLLDAGGVGEADHRAWQAVALDVLVQTFGPDSSICHDFPRPGGLPHMVTRNETEKATNRMAMLRGQIKMIEAAIRHLGRRTSASTTALHLRGSLMTATTPPPPPPPRLDRVFLVHGHNHAAKDRVARFLTDLGLRVTILGEEPSQGRTVYEKFLAHAHDPDLAFAIVLLTADDLGKAVAESEYRRRARQNVIFEMGYFIAQLGREHVCALRESDVEVPSDYHGVIYIPFDATDRWRLDLFTELREAGLPVDPNGLH